MDSNTLNQLLCRNDTVESIKHILQQFEINKHNFHFKRGIYLFGNPGIGKTTFVSHLLKEMDYDVVKYDAGDIRNKNIIETITKNNMADKNVMSLFHRKIKRIVIVMDEIDGMNNGDKGGINALIKLIRPKKTKKQKLEDISLNPIICIGNHHIDKKMKELIKVCHVVELLPPTSTQMKSVILHMIPEIQPPLLTSLLPFLQGDLRKWFSLYPLVAKRPDLLFSSLDSLLQKKSHDEDTKEIARKLLEKPFDLEQHLFMMNETDRTIVGLLWHENIIDCFLLSECKKQNESLALSMEPRKTLDDKTMDDKTMDDKTMDDKAMDDKAMDNQTQKIKQYLELLENMCFADYIDRVTFQKQIWQFNEMSSLIKTMKNNHLCHEWGLLRPLGEIRFTKVLTKYSTEYNNTLFLQNMCQQLGMDKKDMFAFFMNLKMFPTTVLDNTEISKLDMQRMHRFLEKYVKGEDEGEDDADVEVDDDIDVAVNGLLLDEDME